MRDVEEMIVKIYRNIKQYIVQINIISNMLWFIYLKHSLQLVCRLIIVVFLDDGCLKGSNTIHMYEHHALDTTLFTRR